MASTHVHLSADLLERLDRLARETGLSRNRLIVRGCETYIEQARGEWPEDFFSRERIARADVQELHRSLYDWLQHLESARGNRSRKPF